MKEFEFIESLRKYSITAPEGIGDDAALLGDFMISTDTMVQGTHFMPGANIEEVVRHLFASNISDMAAMGCVADGYRVLLNLAAPHNFDKEAFAEIFAEEAKRNGALLIGGDTVTSEILCLTLTIIGLRNKNVLTRSGAKLGDVVFVSRPLGAAKYNLMCKTGARRDLKPMDFEYTPERELGAFLGAFDGVTACIDISDGLGIDLAHIAADSGVKIILDANKIPIADMELPEAEKLEFAISSGEEYALVFTVKLNKAAALEELVQKKFERVLYRVGIVENGYSGGCWMRMGDSVLKNISKKGYEHA